MWVVTEFSFLPGWWSDVFHASEMKDEAGSISCRLHTVHASSTAQPHFTAAPVQTQQHLHNLKNEIWNKTWSFVKTERASDDSWEKCYTNKARGGKLGC